MEVEGVLETHSHYPAVAVRVGDDVVREALVVFLRPFEPSHQSGVQAVDPALTALRIRAPGDRLHAMQQQQQQQRRRHLQGDRGSWATIAVMIAC